MHGRGDLEAGDGLCYRVQSASLVMMACGATRKLPTTVSLYIVALISLRVAAHINFRDAKR